ncbi:unnamed protein product [Caenorhabditis angaria]|uniref:Uncharacterized protein n=1 Tax=Caenorhabditis angaria TaxID=860376 RepID=A0A9P1I5I3_9PELO|nr:unnamed protein product [Caenorhabditis angaria]
MDDFFIDFVIIAAIIAALLIATMVLLFLYSKNLRRFISKCWCCCNSNDDLEKSVIPPKRTTIRVVSSCPSNVISTIPISPTYKNIKPPIRKTTSNPPDFFVSTPTPTNFPVESPSQKFVFIFPKRPTYQMESNQITMHSASTKSSYLPQFIGPQTSRRCST